MLEISVTDFADFVLKVGVCQIKKAEEIHQRGAYDPAKDYRGAGRRHRYALRGPQLRRCVYRFSIFILSRQSAAIGYCASSVLRATF
jgi:hypothetical protein